MLNLIEKEQKQKTFNKKLTISEIEKFYSGSKDSLIGLEYERLSLDVKTLKNANFENMEKIIIHFSKVLKWELVYDGKFIIGAKSPDGTSISLEPGCQLEISIAPKKDVLAIDLELTKIIELLDKIANIYDVRFLGYGITPNASVDEISLIPKRRYNIMAKYLPDCQYGELAPKMMRQTAGIQINVDYINSKDAYLKLKFLNLIMPFMAGLSANSPFENNRLSDLKSIRTNVWRFTGLDRCNFFYKDIFGFLKEDHVFKNYIEAVLNVPMIFIERENKIIEINGKITFRDFIEHGFCGCSATMDDYILHQSLCFPDVRLKKYIEIRYHDSADYKFALALCAFYKGLMEANIKENLKKVSYLKINDIENYNKEIISNGLNYKLKNGKDGWGVILDLFNISRQNLNFAQRAYLEPIFSMIKTRKTNADLIQEYNISKTSDLIELLY